MCWRLMIRSWQKQEIVETLSAAKVPKKDGKGNPYADRFTLEISYYLCLSNIENAAEADRASGLYLGAKLFKAATWEAIGRS